LSSAAREFLGTALPRWEHVAFEIWHESSDSSKIPHWFTPRSLHDLPERVRVRSNDTAFLVAAAPRSLAEIVTSLTEAWFRQYAWAGSDVKVMTVRRGVQWSVTTCVPALAGTLATAAELDDVTYAASVELAGLLKAKLGGPVEVVCNPHGNRVEPLSRQYFTVSGSAIDFGEDGLVGRGNSRGGLICPSHAAGTEALFGKNPSYHVGKVGGWLVDRAADVVASQFGPCRIGIVWRNNAFYDEPASLDISLTSQANMEAAMALARKELRRTDWLEDLIDRQRYLPRVAPLEELWDELDTALSRLGVR
jgi:S-adenosylmethionine synthetase